MIIWLTGQPGSGKTTIAKALVASDPWLAHVDGDDLREIMPNPGYDDYGRYKNIDRAQAIAAYVNHQGYNVVVSLVAPFKGQRDRFKKDNDVLEVYLHTTEERGREQYHVDNYEPPSHDFIAIDTGRVSVTEALRIIHREMAAFSRRAPVADRPEAEAGCTCVDSCPRHGD